MFTVLCPGLPIVISSCLSRQGRSTQLPHVDGDPSVNGMVARNLVLVTYNTLKCSMNMWTLRRPLKKATTLRHLPSSTTYYMTPRSISTNVFRMYMGISISMYFKQPALQTSIISHLNMDLHPLGATSAIESSTTIFIMFSSW